YYYGYRGQKEGVEEVGEPLVIPGLASIQGLAVSPDSSRVAVVGRAEKGMQDWSVYTVGTDSAHKRVELHYGQFNGNPAWSPDGKTIAISEYHRGRHGSLLWDIRLIDVMRRRARWLTRNARAIDPVWSPDGRYILYASHPGQTTNLYLTDPDGEHVTRLTAFTGDVQLQDPQWSPDGAQIVFAVQEEDGDVDIAVVGVDGEGYRKLTRDPEEDLSPLWSAVEAVDRVTEVLTSRRTYRNVADPLEITVGLWDPDPGKGLAIEPLNVTLTVDVQRIGERRLTEVPVKVLKGEFC
ncbi:unnamed protein product, partial [marine sediment metagenome]